MIDHRLEGCAGAPYRSWRLVALASLALGAIMAALLILKVSPAPFFWLWLTWAAALFGAISLVRGSWPRAILLNIGIVACVLAAAEAYYFRINMYVTPVISNGFYVHDDVLGWAPAKGIEGHSFEIGPARLLHHPEGMIFDVIFSIDSNGLRVAPPWCKDHLGGTILFFGDSFTFGEGLKDNESLPYQVGVQSAGRYRTFNFGVNGYGPAQMLAQIEQGMVRRVVDTTPTYAFYVAIPHHVWRVAGRVDWIVRKPRYVLHPDGTVHRAGFFEDAKTSGQFGLGLRLHQKVEQQLKKSALGRMLAVPHPRVTDDDLRLYFAVVRRSQELLKAQYSGLSFHVILWPPNQYAQQPYVYQELRNGFQEMGIPVHLAEDILPGYSTDRSPYILSPVDYHPNALANRLVAQYILSKIVR